MGLGAVVSEALHYLADFSPAQLTANLHRLADEAAALEPAGPTSGADAVQPDPSDEGKEGG
jgi:hypothetical protein